MPRPPLRIDAAGLLTAQLGLELSAIGAQAAALGRVGLVLPAIGGAVGAWLWLRRRVAGGSMTRARLHALAKVSAGVHVAVGALAYVAHALAAPGAYSVEPGALPLGAAAVGALAGLTAGGLTLCAADAAGATGRPAAPTTARPRGQPLSLADLGLGPPPTDQPAEPPTGD